jgi:hypothetical protein
MVGWLEPGKMEHPQFREAIGGGAGSRRGSLHVQRRTGRPACPTSWIPEVRVQYRCAYAKLRKLRTGIHTGKVEEFRRVTKSTRPGKDTGGSRDTHGTHTGHVGTRGRTRAKGHTPHGSLTDEPQYLTQPSKPNKPLQKPTTVVGKSGRKHRERGTGKKIPWGAGTHTGHTGATRAHTGTRITQTNLTTIPTPIPTHQRTRSTTARQQ